MNKQSKLIDADKLLEWMDKKYYRFETKNDFFEGVLEAIKKGYFDPDPIPLPTIKPGDRVIHEERGEGVVKEVYGDEIIADYGDVRIGCNKSKLEVSHD